MFRIGIRLLEFLFGVVQAAFDGAQRKMQTRRDLILRQILEIIQIEDLLFPVAELVQRLADGRVHRPAIEADGGDRFRELVDGQLQLFGFGAVIVRAFILRDAQEPWLQRR